MPTRSLCASVDAGLWGAHSDSVGGDFGSNGGPCCSLRCGSLMVKPIKNVVTAMKSYAAAPEDTRRIIQPSARKCSELGEAEAALKSLQTELTSTLRQRERLASLGGGGRQGEP